MNMLVCIVTSLGMACAVGGSLAGECVQSETAAICIAPVESFDLWASYYDPSEGDTNCDVDCANKASGPVLPEHYGNTAACPHDWLLQTLITPYGNFLCDDRGGAIRLTWRQVYDPERGFYWDWVWVIDFLLDNPADWTYTAIEHWSFAQ